MRASFLRHFCSLSLVGEVFLVCRLDVPLMDVFITPTSSNLPPFAFVIRRWVKLEMAPTAQKLLGQSLSIEKLQSDSATPMVQYFEFDDP